MAPLTLRVPSQVWGDGAAQLFGEAPRSSAAGGMAVRQGCREGEVPKVASAVRGQNIDQMFKYVATSLKQLYSIC